MYTIRIPWRKVVFVDKNREFFEHTELSDRTKKEIVSDPQFKGKSVLSFTRGFLTETATREELADTIFERAYHTACTADMNENR